MRFTESSRLRLLEAPGGDGIFNPDGTVNVAVIRPCDGRGPGSRVYEAAMLAKHAHTFSGLPSYLNHLDPKAQRAAGKLRRGPEELAGELRECHWDPNFTAPDDSQFGYGRGAVVGRFMPASDLVESLLRRIPGQLKLSINSQATSVRPCRRRDGGKGWLVEGMDNDPEFCSVDLVTAAGAGGRVAALLESANPTSARRRDMETQTARFGAEDEAWVQMCRKRGLDPALFGATPAPAASTAQGGSLRESPTGQTSQVLSTNEFINAYLAERQNPRNRWRP